LNGHGTPSALLGIVWAGACSALIWTNATFAGVQDSRFEFAADGASVDFDVRDVPRREVISRLFAGTDVEIKWISSSFADEPMSGKFSGASAAVARQLLGQMNFVIVHDRSGDTSRIVRVVIVGPARGEQSWAGLSAIATAMQRAAKQNAAKTALAGGGSAGADGAKARVAGSSAAHPDLPILSAGIGSAGDAKTILKPAPAGAAAPLPVIPPGTEAPRLIPPSADAALPFTPAPAGTASPLLRN
jgi:hypothetical protein